MYLWVFSNQIKGRKPEIFYKWHVLFEISPSQKHFVCLLRQLISMLLRLSDKSLQSIWVTGIPKNYSFSLKISNSSCHVTAKYKSHDWDFKNCPQSPFFNVLWIFYGLPDLLSRCKPFNKQDIWDVSPAYANLWQLWSGIPWNMFHMR